MTKIFCINEPGVSFGYDFTEVISKLQEKYKGLLDFECISEKSEAISLGITKFPAFVVYKEKTFQILSEGKKDYEDLDALLEMYMGTRNYEYITDPAILDQDTRMC